MEQLALTLPAEDTLVLLPKNPGTFFAFWRFSSGKEEAFLSSAFAPEVELRVFRSEDKSVFFQHRVFWRAGRAYLPVPERGGACEAVLYALRNGEWERLLDSNQAAAPESADRCDDRARASMEFMKGGSHEL
ncbi:MAG: DUF4912 domain-containing protein [Elusimicrobia bacterium]|nr:DUF4912 domain-containing protein [Elusimicrobiota bacterium]